MSGSTTIALLRPARVLQPQRHLRRPRAGAGDATHGAGQQLEVGVPDPGDVAAVGDPVVEGDPEVDLAVLGLELQRPQDLVGARRVLDQQDRERGGRRSRSSRPGRRRPACRRSAEAIRSRLDPERDAPPRSPPGRCRRCRGRAAGSSTSISPPGVRTSSREPSMPRSSIARRGDIGDRALRRRSSGTSSGRGGRRRRARRRRDGRSGGSAWRRRRAAARAAPGRRRRFRSRRRPRARSPLASRPRSAISGSSALRTKPVEPWRRLDHRRPALGEGLDLAVAVELVAEEVAEDDERRGRAAPQPAAARPRRPRRAPPAALLEQRGRDPPGHVGAGAVVDRHAAPGRPARRRSCRRSSSCRSWR